MIFLIPELFSFLNSRYNPDFQLLGKSIRMSLEKSRSHYLMKILKDYETCQNNGIVVRFMQNFKTGS